VVSKQSLPGLTAAMAVAAACPGVAWAQEAGDATAPKRPAIAFNRWQENWSVLANPDTPREPLDGLKYIALSNGDPKTYLSLGANLRERFESNDAAGFGVGGGKADSYVISRLEAHADLRLAGQVQVFVQLQSDFAPGKSRLTPVDQNRLDLEQAFVTVTEPLGDGTLKVRVGRQEMGFDLQRFVGVRDGPNVRQAFDAVWADYETGPWRLISFYSQPVQTRDLHPFDDHSNNRLTYGGVRVERQLTRGVSLAAYVSQYDNANDRFPSAVGKERRTIVDARLAGGLGPWDFDAEAMGQTGKMAAQDVQAWAVGSIAGYTFADAPWSPRLGLQFDAASGDRNAHDGRLETFNPLFPNGYYVTLAGYTGLVNLVHLKTSVTLHPRQDLKLMLATAAQWRQTTGDAVYTQPDVPVAGTAGHAGRYTGAYGQLRLDWSVNPHVNMALEAVHFAIGDALRAVNAHDADYLGLEVRFGW
jgi:hypothetical protein